MVMVDTGNSYEGLCEYLGGKYISYTEERPITMNPFRINRVEMNVEKTGFLKNLVLLIWKGFAGYGHEDGGPPDRTGHHGVLRHLFQRFRRLHAPATGGFA